MKWSHTADMHHNVDAHCTALLGLTLHYYLYYTLKKKNSTSVDWIQKKSLTDNYSVEESGKYFFPALYFCVVVYSVFHKTVKLECEYANRNADTDWKHIFVFIHFKAALE